MRLIICDDDYNIYEQLESNLIYYFNSKGIKHYEISYFSNALELLEDTKEKDIVFLDIEMPGTNGIYAARKLYAQNKNIIIFIVTSYSAYLDDAMKLQVFRYLLKPVDKKRLYRNLDDAIEKYNNLSFRVAIETKLNTTIIDSCSIIMIEARNKKIYVYTSSETYESIQGFAYWLKVLPAGMFIQTHRSYIVNCAFVERFDHFTIYLSKNNLQAYLTRRKYTDFKNRFLLYLESSH